MSLVLENNSIVRISIVIPCYQSGKYIRKCLQSLLDQNDPNLEIIVIDGGSTDNTVAIIREFESAIHYWVSEKDKGQSHAIQKGLDRSTGEIWNWLCADDWLLPGALEKLRQAYKSVPNAVAWVGACQRLHENGWLHYISYPTVLVSENILANFSARMFYQPAAFLKRATVEKVGGIRQELQYAMEYDLYSRLVFQGKFVGFDSVIAVALAQSDAKTVSNTQDAWREKVELLEILGLSDSAAMLQKRIETGLHNWVWPRGWKKIFEDHNLDTSIANQFYERSAQLVIFPKVKLELGQALQHFRDLLSIFIERFPNVSWLIYAPWFPDLETTFESLPGVIWVKNQPDWNSVFSIWELPGANLNQEWWKYASLQGIPLLTTRERLQSLSAIENIQGLSCNESEWKELCWKGVLLRLDPLVWGALVCMGMAQCADGTSTGKSALVKQMEMSIVAKKADAENHLQKSVPSGFVKNTGDVIRINLFVMREYHIPVLEPLWHQFMKIDDVEVGFSWHEFVPAQGSVNEIGLRSETVIKLQKKGWKSWNISPGESPKQLFDAVIVADACYEMVEGWGPIVCIGHGTISKNLYFVDKEICQRENLAALVCVPGPYYVGSYGNQVHTRILDTGFTKMDALAGNKEETRAKIVSQYRLELQTPIVLYAPTFNPDLSSVDLFKDAWTNSEMREVQVLVKLHGSTREQTVKEFATICANTPSMHLIEDGNLSELLMTADIVVSDYSSAYLEAMAINVPVIIGENPRAIDTPWYNPATIEWQARTVAYVVKSTQEFLEVLRKLKEGEDALEQTRQALAQRVFSPLDGKNCERIAEAVQELASSKEFRKPPGAKKVQIICFNQATEQAKKLLEQSSAFGVEWFAPGKTIHNPCLFWDGEKQFAPEWDRSLWNATCLDKDASDSIWAPVLSDSGHSAELFLTYFPKYKGYSNKVLRNFAKMNLQAQSVPLQLPPADCFYIPQTFPYAVLRNMCNAQGMLKFHELRKHSKVRLCLSWFQD